MVQIQIRERPAGPDGSNATVSFDNTGEYPITISDPFAEPEEEQLLEWYFEEHLRFPFLEQVKAQKAAASISTYGETLFKQVFADPEAHTNYRISARAGL